MNEKYFLSDTKPHLCEQQRHSHQLTIKECLFFSLWLTKIIYCTLAKHHPTSVKKQWHLSYAEHPNVTESRYTWKRCHSDKDDGRQPQAWRQAMQLMVGLFLPECKEIEEIWGWIEFVKTNMKDFVNMKNIQIVVLDKEVGQHSQHAWAVIRHF